MDNTAHPHPKPVKVAFGRVTASPIQEVPTPAPGLAIDLSTTPAIEVPSFNPTFPTGGHIE